MIISPIDVIRFQTCPRRWALERGWKVVRRRPKAILDGVLRAAVVRLSNGQALTDVRDEARASLMSEAADPGMALPEGLNPYSVASDLAAILDTSLTAISQLTLLQLAPLSPLPIPATDHSYRPLSLADDSGALHRWLTVDAWDDDAITRELHSWVTAADLAVCDAPLTLHVIVIGSRRGSRWLSPWCRAHEQPITRRLRFQRQNRHHNGKGGERRPPIPDDWREVWYADMPKPDPEAWVAAIERDGLMPRLLQHPAIAEFPSEVRRQVLQQLSTIADDMDRTATRLGPSPADHGGDVADAPEPAMTLPMVRSACDGMVPCPWVDACYRADPAHGIATLGGYSRRDASGRDDGRRESTPAPSRTQGIAGIPGLAMTSGCDGIRTGG